MKRPSNVLWITLLTTLLFAGAAGAALIDALSATFTAPNDRGAQLRITGPKGFVFEHTLKAGEVFAFSPYDADGKLLADGLYRWNVAALSATAPAPSNRSSLVSDAKRGLGKAGLGRAEVQSGYFTLSGGYFVTAAVEESADKDQVILDDLIVDGSACVGLDCVNGESFGFDTIRMKENNTRLKFEDTSTGTFPSVDWQLTANDSANGGANRFSIDDITNGRTPFTVEANAPSHSLYVDDGGRIGIGTNTPVVQLHVKDGNTPTLRLEQDGSSGFAAQTWDVAGNEANFFVRDATNGSTLPFRIQPGAPSNAISVRSSGAIGMGIQSPGNMDDSNQATVHIRRTDGTAGLLIEEASGTNDDSRFLLEMRNNGFANFTMTDTSSNDSWDFSAAGAFRINKQGSGASEFTLFSGGDLQISGDLTVVGGCTGCDAVFTPEFDLESIEEHAELMWQNSYLPGVGPTPEGPTQVRVFEKVTGMLQELEKAHIYIEQLNDQLKEKASEVDDLKARLARLEALIDQQ
jgi:hypothetical protein